MKGDRSVPSFVGMVGNLPGSHQLWTNFLWQSEGALPCSLRLGPRASSDQSFPREWDGPSAPTCFTNSRHGVVAGLWSLGCWQPARAGRPRSISCREGAFRGGAMLCAEVGHSPPSFAFTRGLSNILCMLSTGLRVGTWLHEGTLPSALPTLGSCKSPHLRALCVMARSAGPLDVGTHGF